MSASKQQARVRALLRPARYTLIALLAVAAFAFTGHQFSIDAEQAGTDTSASGTVVINGENVKLHHISAEQCRMCHSEIYDQWKSSMHAKSTALTDPIHRAFYMQEVGDPKDEGTIHKKSGKYPVCLKCHAPNAAQDGKTKLDALPAYSEGVNCMTCHRLKSFKGTKKPGGGLQLGIDAYEISDRCQGPSGFPMSFAKHADQARKEMEYSSSGIPNPHINRPFVDKNVDAEMLLPMDQNPSLLKTSAACLGCHDKRNNPNGVPLCNTGDEYMQGNTHVSCQSCHMPVSGGFADHSMGGGHNMEMLRRALNLKIETKIKGDKIHAEILIHNQQPHKVPTGAPFRNMMLRVSAYDVDGKILWTNYTKHPANEDPQAYFFMQLVKDGKPAPPPIATQMGPDSRLEPYERRTLKYELPAENVAMVRAEMFYNLLWPSLVKKFSHLPEHLREPKLIAFAETRN